MEVKYIKMQSPTEQEVYFSNPIWLSLYRLDGPWYEWIKEEDTKGHALKMIKEKGGIIFEEILDKGKTNLEKLSEDEVYILLEVHRALSKITGIR